MPAVNPGARSWNGQGDGPRYWAPDPPTWRDDTTKAGGEEMA